jgi:hypothetical protein
MLERQHLTCSLGATVVMTDPEHDFIGEGAMGDAAPRAENGLESRNSFGDAVRFILSGTTCLKVHTGR